jgi:DNA-binding CsgD family transcriptional regulator
MRQPSLTLKERQVLALICSGDYHKTVAHKMGITHKQVEYIVEKVVKKLDGKGKSSAWLGVQALRLQLLD